MSSYTLKRDLPNERQNAHGANITKNVQHWKLEIQIYVEPVFTIASDARPI
ncbi:MAG: hypothetical protein AAFY76_26055 [Cyanobacteria bacterium J06649_11]